LVVLLLHVGRAQTKQPKQRVKRLHDHQITIKSGHQLLRSVIAVCTRKFILAYPYHGPLWSFDACRLL
jgi:hypothetical protein